MSKMRPLHVKNALIWGDYGGEHRDLYTSESVTAKPHHAALSVDLAGHLVMPGLVNAHDHLELNHYPRTRYRDRYVNAHDWGEDVNAQLDNPPLSDLRAAPLADQLFIGGLKNLLCGATSVIHHNPLHKPLRQGQFPVRVLQSYGWSHSLHFETELDIVESYQRTPPDVPWFIHLAEGTDDRAAHEYQRLKALDCVGKNTVIVHGVGLTEADIVDAAPRVRGLVWCPSTNFYLLGETARIKRWLTAGGRVAIGSDSRLTADGDLLDELVLATRHTPAWGSQPADLFPGHRNDLQPGAPADWFALEMTVDLGTTSRANIALVVRGGVPQIGTPDLMAKFPHIEVVPATLDGIPKAINRDLAEKIAACSLAEDGLEIATDDVLNANLLHKTSMSKWLKRIF